MVQGEPKAHTGSCFLRSRPANPLLHELVHETFTVVGGQLEIPDRPGLGIMRTSCAAKRGTDGAVSPASCPYTIAWT